MHILQLRACIAQVMKAYLFFEQEADTATVKARRNISMWHTAEDPHTVIYDDAISTIDCGNITNRQ